MRAVARGFEVPPVLALKSPRMCLTLFNLLHRKGSCVMSGTCFRYVRKRPCFRKLDAYICTDGDVVMTAS